MRWSRTKIGAVIGGVGIILSTVAAYFLGDLELAEAIAAIITEVGVVVTIFGIRGWAILNRGKK